MHAVVIIAGSQFQVAENDEIVVPHLSADPNATVEFDNVVMTIDGDGINVGGGKVTATVLEHGRDDKVIVFHKKRRKGFRKMNGHRQEYTKIRVTGVSA
ncbi:MAG: 50S ribosomal protein L21 [Candidatus Kapaibacterium sp.]